MIRQTVWGRAVEIDRMLREIEDDILEDDTIAEYRFGDRHPFVMHDGEIYAMVSIEKLTHNDLEL